MKQNICAIIPAMNEKNQDSDVAKSKKKRGPPFGNQNARMHGYYCKSLSQPERDELNKAPGNVLDRRIMLLKIRIRNILLSAPGNSRVLNHAMMELLKALQTKYNIDGNDVEGLTEALRKVVRDIALPLGMWREG